MFWEPQPLDWYTATNPDELLRAARPLEKVTTKPDAERKRRRASYERRLRLFGCACARTIWNLLPTDAQSAVAISERFADGRATQADLHAAAVRMVIVPVTYQQHAVCAAGRAADAVYSIRWSNEAEYNWEPMDAARSAAKALATRAAGLTPPGNPAGTAWEAAWNAVWNAARAHQAELVRDIFPPLDSVVGSQRLEREWLTSTVIALARQMDDTGDFSAVPILADALQDAGCDSDTILNRCRAESGVHCRGNWVVDLVLGRE